MSNELIVLFVVLFIIALVGLIGSASNYGDNDFDRDARDRNRE